MRTFKGVSKYFSEVFSEFVPGGRASLVMLKSTTVNDENDTRRGRGRRRKSGRTQAVDMDEEENAPSRIEYSGVAMKRRRKEGGEAHSSKGVAGVHAARKRTRSPGRYPGLTHIVRTGRVSSEQPATRSFHRFTHPPFSSSRVNGRSTSRSGSLNGESPLNVPLPPLGMLCPPLLL